MSKKAIKATKKLNTGSMLSNYFSQNRTPLAALARALDIKPASVVAYKKTASIQSKTLWKISNVLKHNFFMDIAIMLPKSYTTNEDIFEEKNTLIAQLKEENKILKAEKAVLLQSKK